MEDMAHVHQAVHPHEDPSLAQQQVQTVLDAVHTDLRYPDAVVPARDQGFDTVLSAVNTLLERARGGAAGKKPTQET